MSTPAEPAARRPPLRSVPATSVSGDEARRDALAALHREHYAGLVRLACLLVDHQEAAEEVVQEAFVRLHGSFDRVDDPADRPAYLRSIVMNTARSRLRRRLVVRRHPPVPEVAAGPADSGALQREDQREVIAALRTLPVRQRECLVLRFYGDCSEVEIAAALGITTGSVKTHVSRGMKAMTKQLEAKQ